MARVMFEYEGSRSEFLKLLAECGEEPAFIARARAPLTALDELLRACEAKRDEMLKWPKYHFSALAHQVQKDWSRVGSLLAVPESMALLEALCASLLTSAPVRTSNWFTSDKAALRQFLESAERFNRNWKAHIDGLDLEPVNRPRHEYNQFYVLEKTCAFASERIADGFEPLEIIDRAWLYAHFPLLKLPMLA